MGRVTRGASRGVDKYLGGKSANTGWFKQLKVWLLVAVVVGVVGSAFGAIGGGPQDDADDTTTTTTRSGATGAQEGNTDTPVGNGTQAAKSTPANPSPSSTQSASAAAGPGKVPATLGRVECDTKVRWDFDDTHAPSGVNTFEVVQWAYQQVAEPANVDTLQVGGADLRWVWQTAKDGEYRPGETYRATDNWGEKYLLHALNGDREWTRDALREHVLRSILTDFGVESPTSNGSGLTVRDSEALSRICAKNADSEGEGLLGGLFGSIGGGSEATGSPGILGGFRAADKVALGVAVLLGLFLVFGERVLPTRGARAATDSEDQVDS